METSPVQSKFIIMKYKLTEETINVYGRTLHRIECVEPFKDIEAGDKGGFVESENNLSQDGGAWVYGDAMVYGGAWVYGDAWVCDDARVYDHAVVYGHAEVYGHALVYGHARVSGINDYIVFKNSWSSGRHFTWTRSNDKWKVGCFYGTGAELIKKAYKDSENSGRHYEAYVNFVEQLKAME